MISLCNPVLAQHSFSWDKQQQQPDEDKGDDGRLARKRISGRSCHKQYNFAAGLQHDVEATRKALRACCCYRNNEFLSTTKPSCSMTTTATATTFRALFVASDGHIANLNRVLQNLKRAREIDFALECFFMGYNDEQENVLLDAFFWI